MPSVSTSGPPPIARYIASAILGLAILLNNTVFTIRKDQSSLSLAQSANAIFRIDTISGSTIRSRVLVYPNGNMNLSGTIVLQARPSCALLQTTSTGMVICSSASIAPEVGTTSFSGATLTLGDSRYVRKSGSTMTGVLVIDITGGNSNTIGLRIINTGSGRQLHAEQSLTSSGSLSVENTMSGSKIFGKICPRIVSLPITASGTALTTGSGKYTLMVPPELSGYTLAHFAAAVDQAGTTGLFRMGIRNVDKNKRQMFSTLPSIDSGEEKTTTAATPWAIASNADVGGYDRLTFDILQVQTTAPKGLNATLRFSCP